MEKSPLTVALARLSSAQRAQDQAYAKRDELQHQITARIGHISDLQDIVALLKEPQPVLKIDGVTGGVTVPFTTLGNDMAPALTSGDRAEAAR